MTSNRIPPSVRPFHKIGGKNLQVNYFPGVALFRRDADALTSNNAVKRIRSLDTFHKAQLRPDVLRWTVVTHTSNKLLPLSTQRNRLRRRWSSAIVAGLRKQHLGRDGKLLGNSEMSKMQGVQELGGTLEILVHAAHGWDMESIEMQKQADAIIDGLLKAGLGTRRVTARDLERDVQPRAKTVTSRQRDGSRATPRPFDSSRYKPSWYGASRDT